MTTLRTLYGNRPDYTTYITYYNGHTEAFLHCGRCMSIIPEGVRCGHCSVRQEKQAERFEAFIQSKKGETYAPDISDIV